MTVISRSPLSNLAGTWKLDSSHAASTVTVKLRSGPVTYIARAAVELGVVRVSGGSLQVDLVLDEDWIASAACRDARWGAYTQALRDAGSVVQFQSSRMSAVATDVTRVTGRLRVGRRRLAVSFELRTAERDGALDVVATIAVAPRKLGLHWLPAGAPKAPTELVLKARLAPVARTVARTSPPVPPRGSAGALAG